MMRRALLVLAGLLAAIVPAGVAAAVDQPDWSLSASAYLYVVPFDDTFIRPTVDADRDHLHFELRYNYEDRG